MDNELDKPWIGPKLRVAFLFLCVIASLVLLAIVIHHSEPGRLAKVGTLDFTQYWSAAQLLLQKRNPYDAMQLLAVERSVGLMSAEPILMWNPPWVLSLVLPFTALPFDTAAIIWLVNNLFLTMACGALLWSMYSPTNAKRLWLGLIITATSIPVLKALQMGQISPWLLVGITGFLLAYRRKKDYLAGVAILFLTIKPHIVYLLLTSIAWWVLRERRWKVLVGGAAAIIGACAVVGLISPDIFIQYLRAVSTPPLYWRSATLGTWLRTLYGPEKHWLQFLPTGIGLVGFLVWVVQYKGKWDWPNLVPVLLLVSIISAVYGWGFDQVILLPLVVVLIVTIKNTPSICKVLILSCYILSQLVLILQTQLMVDSSVAFWYPLFLAGLYGCQQVAATRLNRSRIENEYISKW